jgi:hypothetical protein
MGYVSKETKAKITAKLKEVMPKGWKYTVAVFDLQMIRVRIAQAPVDLVALCQRKRDDHNNFVQLDTLRLEKQFSGEVLEAMLKIKAALDIDNYDHSDHIRGYSDFGYSIGIHLGSEASSFKVTA